MRLYGTHRSVWNLVTCVIYQSGSAVWTKAWIRQEVTCMQSDNAAISLTVQVDDLTIAYVPALFRNMDAKMSKVAHYICLKQTSTLVGNSCLRT